MKRIHPVLFFAFAFIASTPAVYAVETIPPGRILGLEPVGPAYTLRLDPVDHQDLIADDSRGAEIPLRVGINRGLPPVDFTSGVVIETEFGSLWRMRIVSPGAYFMRVNVRSCRMAGGDELFIYGSHEEVSPVYFGDGPAETCEFWSWMTAGDSVIIEWLTDAVFSEVSELPFRIPEISHAYRDFMNNDESRAAGWCHNDATCDQGYRTERDASAKISFNDGGWYVCSGTMLNTSTQSYIPYFATANHCVSTNAVADTVQAFFAYHTSVCDSGSATHGQSKNGAEVMATSGASDFTLLRLDGSNFAGIYFAGWTRIEAGTGTAVTSIHHPDGDYKRISYGTTISSYYPNQYGVRWNRTGNPGVTEPGSSGGGLFTDSDHRFIGQLYGGSSSCDNQSAPDYYGQFNISFSNLNLQNRLGDVMFCNGSYFQSGAATSTPIPTATPQPQVPTNTPLMTWTPTPAATAQPSPTPPCGSLGVRIRMPQQFYYPGSICSCEILMCNPGPDILADVPVFAILEIAGNYFFAPSFGAFDHYTQTLPPGWTSIKVLEAFPWPENSGSYSMANWYGAMTDEAVTRILGTFDIFSFSWSD